MWRRQKRDKKCQQCGIILNGIKKVKQLSACTISSSSNTSAGNTMNYMPGARLLTDYVFVPFAKDSLLSVIVIVFFIVIVIVIHLSVLCENIL